MFLWIIFLFISLSYKYLKNNFPKNKFNKIKTNKAKIFISILKSILKNENISMHIKIAENNGKMSLNKKLTKSDSYLVFFVLIMNEDKK